MQQSSAREHPYTGAIFRRLGSFNIDVRFMAVAAVSLVGLYYANLYSFLLFHVLIEIFSVIVAFAIFMFTWNTRQKIHNSGLILLGAAYLVVGGLDLLHMLSYKGMGVFGGAYGANAATQLWIAARYIESISLAVAPLVANREIRMTRAITVYTGLLILVIIGVFIRPVFPTCYIEGVGLTPFKKISEYVIAAILMAGLAILARRKRHFDPVVCRMLTASILLTVASELMFTFYISVYGISNLVGHLFKLASFWLIYKAIIETGLQRPYTLLFRELAQSEKRYCNLVDTLPTGICEIDPAFRITYINPAGLEIIGYDEEDVRRGINLDMVLKPDDHEKARKRIDVLLGGRPIASTEYRIIRKDGSREDVIVNSTPIYRDGDLISIQTTLTDVTAFNRLKSRLHQAGKMEAVAILAGGMAHEVNNLLMGVAGRIELLKLSAGQRQLKDSDFSKVLDGCDRIAALITQLLAYSRGGRYQPNLTDLSEFITEIIPDIEKQLKPGIRLSGDAEPAPPKISADPKQLHMVVMEIIENATEAIDGEGQIEIQVQSMDIDPARSRQRPGMQPGRYVGLRVHDTGRGMDAKTRQHIFEPFYTNKFPGRGLGMAAVYGIVKNHGGWIGVESEPGLGTMVQIYFPVYRPSDPGQDGQPEKTS